MPVSKRFASKYIRFGILLILLIFIAGCSLTRYVPEGDYLVRSVSVRSDNKNIKSSDVKPYIKQMPNHKTFGLVSFPLYLYDLSGTDSTKWINRFLRRAGNAPEIYDPMLTVRSEKEILKMLDNKGYLEGAVDVKLEKKNKKIDIIYNITSNEPFKIESFKYSIPGDSVRTIVYKDTTSSLIKPGMLLDRDVLENERVRITNRIRNNGYWGFNKDFINYRADTAAYSKNVDLTLNVATNPGDVFHKKFNVGKVVFVTDYDPVNALYSTQKRDTVSIGDYTIIEGAKSYLRSGTLIENCFIRPGALYSDRAVDATYSSFARLKILKYVNIRFEQSKVNDDLVDCYIYLTPGKNQSIQTELEGTNSAGDFGFAVGASYQHRNAFKGSETFTTKIRGGYENLTGEGGIVNDNYTEYGIETGITFPKFMFPFLKSDFRRRIKASTEFNAAYSYQHRPEYTRMIAGGGWKYNWQTQRNKFRHQLDLIDVSYVYLPFRSEAFIDSIINQNPISYSSYKDHLISRTAYTFYRSNFNPSVRNMDIFTFRASSEVAGNTLYAFSKILNQHKKDDAYRFLGLRYEQYWKTDVDYAYTKVFSEKNSIAFHIAGGVGIPYGNTNILPFEKRYYSGGANSVRGWSVRTLGPGRYSSNNPSLDYFNQCGDIRLDGSIEYRTRLFWKLELAAFVDAGNVWTIRDYSAQPGGLFKFDSFYKEIALAWGLGMRLDFSYFILRLDLGFKAYDPAKINASPWVIDSPFGSNNRALHFAVGYPF
ncbi:MAG: BamA/TamA family outer membrane protein [Bacteroidales bacterium]|nr:BamA/TamA family outer membrane protein [Bacteroidales bacterium]